MEFRASLKGLARRVRALLARGGLAVARELDLVMSVEGQISRAEARALIDLATATAPGSVIVELGSYRGRSAVALGLGARRAGIERVFAVDPHEDFRGIHGGVFGPADREQLEANLARTGLGDTVAVISRSSAEAATSWTGPPIGLLFVDGDHRYEAVRGDWEAWRPHLAPAATVAFHDSDSPGVARMLGRLAGEGHLVATGRVAALSWWRLSA